MNRSNSRFIMNEHWVKPTIIDGHGTQAQGAPLRLLMGTFIDGQARGVPPRLLVGMACRRKVHSRWALIGTVCRHKVRRQPVQRPAVVWHQCSRSVHSP